MARSILKVSEAASGAILLGLSERESVVNTGQRERTAGVLLMAAGVAFYVAAALAHQLPFYGAGTALLGAGVAFLVKARKRG
jgi:hypothetical protein